MQLHPSAILARPSARWLALVVTLLGASGAGRVEAAIEFVDLYRSQYLTQSGDGLAGVTSNGFSFATRLYASSPNLYDTVTVLTPGPAGSLGLAPQPGFPDTYIGGSALLPTKGDMDSQFPAGDYAYDATNGNGTDSTVLTVPAAENYPDSLPFLAGTTFSQLQGVNANQPFQVLFSPFDTGAGANESFIFFTIFDQTDNQSIYDAGFLPAAATGVLLPANLLTGGHDYSFELIFSNRVLADTPGTTFPSQLGFDYRTSGRFTATAGPAAVPEPASAALAAPAALALLACAWRRRRA